MSLWSKRCAESCLDVLSGSKTVLVWPPRAAGELFPTAVFSDGAYMLNRDKERFILGVHTEVRDNHQRGNKLQFKTIETDGLRIEFLSTNGSPDVHLFDVRVY